MLCCTIVNYAVKHACMVLALKKKRKLVECDSLHMSHKVVFPCVTV